MTIAQYEIEIILTSNDEKMDSFIGGSYMHAAGTTVSQFFFLILTTLLRERSVYTIIE
jgi:hypothetical protein